jgi:hypothetical protein
MTVIAQFRALLSSLWRRPESFRDQTVTITEVSADPAGPPSDYAPTTPADAPYPGNLDTVGQDAASSRRLSPDVRRTGGYGSPGGGAATDTHSWQTLPRGTSVDAPHSMRPEERTTGWCPTEGPTQRSSPHRAGVSANTRPEFTCLPPTRVAGPSAAGTNPGSRVADENTETAAPPSADLDDPAYPQVPAQRSLPTGSVRRGTPPTSTAASRRDGLGPPPRPPETCREIRPAVRGRRQRRDVRRAGAGRGVEQRDGPFCQASRPTTEPRSGPASPVQRAPAGSLTGLSPVVSSWSPSRRRRCACRGAGPGSGHGADPTAPGPPPRP